jgi:hypothetical protein
MSLISLASKEPAAFATYSIEQIVAICGDGKLRDNGTCSEQLRDFLVKQSGDSLERYAAFCLSNKFDRSGYVLQDVVNEIGRRLGYEVKNGRYAGVQNDVGLPTPIELTWISFVDTAKSSTQRWPRGLTQFLH